MATNYSKNRTSEGALLMTKTVTAGTRHED